MWEVLAAFIEKAAIYGAGFFSYGATYEPEVPEELKQE